MEIHLIEREQRVPRPPEEVFPFFADALNLERLTPEWLHFRVLSQSPGEIGAGTLIRYRLRLHGVPVRWLTRIEQWLPGRRFADIQLRGPYRLWHHVHEFEPDGDGTLMRDEVRFAMRAGPAGRLALRAFVRDDVERIFDHRSRRIAEIFEGSPARRAPDRAGVGVSRPA
jgi:ligand-binding SRPBCC domain-containing protein